MKSFIIKAILITSSLLVLYVQGGPKNQTCLSVDNSALVTLRKTCNMSKVLECYKQKGPNLHSKSFKYSLPNLPKSSLLPEIRHLPALPCARVH